ncbi:hypothetical protein ABEW24_23970 [Paenibacillus jamilae]|uniref:hypothetical protein n=1 Tax=Paenibacillus TaxID=44249 RepID=UPI00077CBF64|nr:hypothetical protein [Paenibacillus polymyxa]KYG95709.1 hypothetical protein AZE31_18185 [Paenibacillus polymyxa]
MLEMTDQQLDKALAELMGYAVEKEATGGYALKYNGEDQGKRWMRAVFAWEQAPDYCTDPAASLEVQAKAVEVDAASYVQNLQEIKWGYMFTETLLVRIAELINASPRERAEAAYMTLSSQDLHPLREDI